MTAAANFVNPTAPANRFARRWRVRRHIRTARLVKVRETHISWVLLAGELAYKLKKPLVLDFVDYSTAEKRDEMSREEVRLNRRLASDLYLGVRGVVLTDDGVQLVEQDDSRADDLLVEMRRYDERDTIAARLERGELARQQIAEVGRVLARFHANARRVPVDRAPLLAGGQRFGDELVTAYPDAGVDSGGDQLIAFYATYRALVRAKIAIVRAAQLESDGTELEIFGAGAVHAFVGDGVHRQRLSETVYTGSGADGERFSISSPVRRT